MHRRAWAEKAGQIAWAFPRFPLLLADLHDLARCVEVYFSTSPVPFLRQDRLRAWEAIPVWMVHRQGRPAKRVWTHARPNHRGRASAGGWAWAHPDQSRAVQHSNQQERLFSFWKKIFRRTLFWVLALHQLRALARGPQQQRPAPGGGVIKNGGYRAALRQGLRNRNGGAVGTPPSRGHGDEGAQGGGRQTGGEGRAGGCYRGEKRTRHETTKTGAMKRTKPNEREARIVAMKRTCKQQGERGGSGAMMMEKMEKMMIKSSQSPAPGGASGAAAVLPSERIPGNSTAYEAVEVASEVPSDVPEAAAAGSFLLWSFSSSA